MVYGRYNELVFMGFVNQLIHITFGGTILYKVGPPNDSVQLVQITPITMIYATYNYSIHGVYKPSNITGGHHPVPPLFGGSIPHIGAAPDDLADLAVGVSDSSKHLETPNGMNSRSGFHGETGDWVPSGNLLHSYCKWSIEIVYLPIEDGEFP